MGRFFKLNWLKWLAAGLALGGAAELIRGFAALFDPLTLDYSEMIVAGMARQLSRTSSLAAIYAPLTTPYALPGVQYPPLFIWLNLLLLKLTGLPPLLSTRLLAWTAYAGSGFLVGGLVWQETRQRWAAVVAAGLPFCFWSVIIFINAARPDPLALFFSLLAAFFYRRMGKSNSLSKDRSDQTTMKLECHSERGTSEESVAENLRGAEFNILATDAAGYPLGGRASIPGTPSVPTRRDNEPAFVQIGVGSVSVKAHLLKLFAIALLCALAFLSKQTYLAIGAAIFFDLMLTRGRRRAALFFGLTLVALLVGGILLVNTLADGTFVGIFDPARAARFIFDKVPGFVGFFVLDHSPLFLIAGASMVWQLRRGEKFWPLYTLFATLACAAIVKDGAVDYYFNELAYVLSVNVGLALAGNSTEPRAKNWLTAAIGVQMLIAVAMFGAWGQGRAFDNFRQAYSEGVTLVQTAQAQNRPVLIFADNLLLATNHTDLIGDYFIYSILVENKRRDPQPLVSDLERGYYDFVIGEEFFRWPQVFQTALDKYYTLHYLDGQDGRHLFRLYLRKT